MIDTAHLAEYVQRSTEGLNYVSEGSEIIVYNRFRDKIATLDLSYADEKIYNDRWFGFVTSEEYKEIMSGPYIDYFVKTSCTKKICDTSLLRIGMDKETSEWFIRDILPKMLKGGLTHNAIIIPKELYAQQSMGYFEENLKNNLARLFPSLETAYYWLKSV